MNSRWQGYVEQREKYTRALEQRCSDLEQALSHRHHDHPHHQQQQQHQQQLTDEQQRRVDQILLDQRQKAELAEEARLKVGPVHLCKVQPIISISTGVILRDKPHATIFLDWGDTNTTTFFRTTLFIRIWQKTMKHRRSQYEARGGNCLLLHLRFFFP